MFYFNNIENKKILRSDLINSTQAFFTTKDICICDKVNPNNETILQNKQIISKYLNITNDKFIQPNQTHSANIQVIHPDKTSYPDTDALILTDKSSAIYLNFADCTPIIFYDEHKNIGAIAHAGWRGTALRISALTALKLINQFNSKVENLKVIIGPAICSNCYNVGEDIVNQLKQTVNNFEGMYHIKNNKFYVDLKQINKKQLTELGVNKIDICPYCTCCDNGYFYSYRKENKTSLRHSAVLNLNQY